MVHASNSRFSKALKEAFSAYAFDLLALIAGFLLISQIDFFQASPWAIALYPGIIGAKGVLEGLLSDRLITGLHLGLIHPRFSKNTSSFYKLIGAVVALTLVASVALSFVSMLFGYLIWGVAISELSSILLVVLATMALGLLLLVITVKVAFISFKRSLDPDITVYSLMSVIATIIITLCYVATLDVFFSYPTLGKWVTGAIAIAHFAAVFYLFPKNIKNSEFLQTIRESLAGLLTVAVIFGVAGTLLKEFNNLPNLEISYVLYPVLLGLGITVGSLVGSTATTKLALGMLKPKLSSIGNHLKNILSAWLVSVVLFIAMAMISLSLIGALTLNNIAFTLVLVLITNAVAFTLIIFTSYTISLLTFQKGLDINTFLPIQNALSTTITTGALLLALTILAL